MPRKSKKGNGIGVYKLLDIKRLEATLEEHKSFIAKAINTARTKCRPRILQKEAAAIVGVSLYQWQKYENGIDHISAPKLYRFAKAVGHPICYFFPCDNEDAKFFTLLKDLPELCKLVENYMGISDEHTKDMIFNMIQGFAEKKKE